MKKGFKMLLMCMAVALPMLFLPFMAKAEDKEVKIIVTAIPDNGSNAKYLMCGSSLTFSVEINNSQVDKDNASIDWEVTKKDGTPMQAVYDVINNGTDLEVYAPYGYSEELEVSVCVNGNAELTDTYMFETQENEKMVGKTFFQFDTGNMKDTITCDAFTEEWNASEQTYTITLPGVVSDNEFIHFLGWKSSEGGDYVEGEKLTLPRKNGFVCMSAWYEVPDESGVSATEEPTGTADPNVTTNPAVTADSTETPQVSSIPSIIPEVTTEPAVSATPVVEGEVEVTTAPEVTTEPTVTGTPQVTTKPVVSPTPEVTTVPELTQVPASTSTPEVTKAPEVTNVPAATNTPQDITEPTAKPETDKIKTVSKVTAKKTGSRKIKVSWSKVSNVKGYRIAYSTNKNFKNNSTKYKTTTATKASLTKLTKNKTYYVKVCAYKVVDGKRVYGTYSNVKKIALK